MLILATEEEKEGYNQLFKMMHDAFEKWDLACMKVLAKWFNREALKEDTREEGGDSKENTIDILDALWNTLQQTKREIELLKRGSSYQSHLQAEAEQEKRRAAERKKFEKDIEEYKTQIKALKEILDKKEEMHVTGGEQ